MLHWPKSETVGITQVSLQEEWVPLTVVNSGLEEERIPLIVVNSGPEQEESKMLGVAQGLAAGSISPSQPKSVGVGMTQNPPVQGSSLSVDVGEVVGEKVLVLCPGIFAGAVSASMSQLGHIGVPQTLVVVTTSEDFCDSQMQE